ncbi:MAG: hypothetical protein F4Y22_10250 [Gammaproteobacteria bacterium]|nr:hypothetical protein [Gammaproteobacteria bacterium]MYH47116.1 hypothetical protein [Gammaproteobacteria bacterium]MYL14422.1 hypothetical protein [Gammaproteobacteria bacterium]
MRPKIIFGLSLLFLLAAWSPHKAEAAGQIKCLVENRCTIDAEYRVAHPYDYTSVVCLLGGARFAPGRQVQCGISFHAREDVLVHTNSRVIAEREQRITGQPVRIVGGKVEIWISGGGKYVTPRRMIVEDTNVDGVFEFEILTNMFLGNGYTGPNFRRRWDNRPVTINWQPVCRDEQGQAYRLTKLDRCWRNHSASFHYQTFEGTGYFDDWEHWDSVYRLKKDFEFNGVDQYLAQKYWHRNGQ